MTDTLRTPCTVNGIRWSKPEIAFLISHYTFMGDVEMCEKMNQHFPREQPWTRKCIAKKRVRMELFRTPDQLLAIRVENSVKLTTSIRFKLTTCSGRN
jgi:hypothetical protein